MVPLNLENALLRHRSGFPGLTVPKILGSADEDRERRVETPSEGRRSVRSIKTEYRNNIFFARSTRKLFYTPRFLS